jgi:ATP-dependent Clp protease protease subunit
MKYILPIIGEIGVDFTYSDALMHVNKSNGEPIHLVIDSPGGYVDEAEKISELLQGKVQSTSNSGDVASAAVDLFLLGEERVFYHNKGIFLIHNPWAEMKGEAVDFSHAASEMKKMEDKYIKLYSKITGSNPDVIKGFMKENVPLTAEQIQELGFATVKTFELKAVAKLNLNNNKMEIKDELDNMEKSLLSKIKALFEPKIKALVISDANGNELEMPDIEDVSQIAVGVKVNEGGSPANGEYVQPDGTIIVAVEGAVSEIKEPESEVESLRQENETLKAELEAQKASMEAEKLKAETAVTEIKDEFTKFKAKMSSYIPAEPVPSPEPSNTKKSFTYKRK